jgi:hypothetical protein
MLRGIALALLLPFTVGFDGPGARAALDLAFHNLYGVDVLAGVELLVDDGGEQTWTQFAYGRKQDAEGTRTLIYLPEGRAGGRALLFQRPGRRDRIFVSDGPRGQVRALSAGEHRWGLFSSDFAYADIRAKRADDYRIEVLGNDRIDGEPSRALRLRPFDGPYEKLIVWLSTERPVIVRVDYFDRHGLWKRYRADVAQIQEHYEWWVPMRDEMLDLRSGSRTTRQIKNIVVDAAVPDEMFTTTQLARGRLPSF